MSLQPRIKLLRVGAGRLAGKNPVAERIRETGLYVPSTLGGDARRPGARRNLL